MGYGMLSLLTSQYRFDDDKNFTDLSEWMVGESLQLNLNLLPKDTFVYDEYPGYELEKTFDKVDFYNELTIGISLASFETNKFFAPFVPVATYDSGKDVHRGEEFVSMIEGSVMPYFGFAYRLDKVQFGFHATSGSA